MDGSAGVVRRAATREDRNSWLQFLTAGLVMQKCIVLGEQVSPRLAFIRCRLGCVYVFCLVAIKRFVVTLRCRIVGGSGRVAVRSLRWF